MIAKKHSFGSKVIVPVLLCVWMNVTSGMMNIQMIPRHPVISESVTLSVTEISGKIQSYIWYKGPNTNNSYQILSFFLGRVYLQSSGPLFHDRMEAFPNGSLRISNLNKADEGNYTMLIRADTERKTSVYLQIYEIVGKPTITASTSNPMENDAVTLTCPSSPSHAERTIWSRVPSEATLSSDNTALSFSRITRMNSGNYQCITENPVSSMTSDPYTLTVAYMVGKPTITASTSNPRENDAVTLTCNSFSAERTIWSNVSSGASLSSDNRTLSFSRITRMNSGNYQCTIENSVSSMTSDPYTLTVASSNLSQTMCPSGSGLGIGQTAAIVIGTVGGLLILEVIVYLIIRTKRKTPSLVCENKYVAEQHNYEVTLPKVKIINFFLFLLSLAVLLSMWMDVASGMMSIQLTPQNPIIGGSVTLSVIGITGRIQTFSWFKGSTDGNNQFLAYFPGQNPPLTPGPLYHNRLEAFPDGSLRISKLNRSDEGSYTVRIQADKQSEISVDLKIYELVVKPYITASTSLPKENDTVILTCTSTNAERIEWSRVPIGATRSPDNKTVTFSRINRLDSGDYSCTAINPVDEKKSDLIKITVAYGPENVKIKALSLTDSLISLECSADSVPEASFYWTLNGTDINIKQNLFQVDRKKAENEGTYTCVAKNSVTQLTATESKYVDITIELPVSETIPCRSGNGLDSGIIAVIVIGTVIGILIIEVIVYFALRKRKDKPTGSVYENVHIPQQSKNEMTLQGLAANQTQESNYEQLTHKDKSIYSALESAAVK
ncbi:uncharacterized protein [Pyxicephalus adspersus]|uniref:uncharacterized protein n=1 Tax=Pyxicephalus adspersus TaxID=30357 RepID=UPI003B5A5728